MSCLFPTKAIKELAKSFQFETEGTVRNMISLWQSDNNKGPEELPTKKQLYRFMLKERSFPNKVEIYEGNWSREEVEQSTDKVFLFGDNTDDRLNTHYVPSSTQAVIRGLPNAVGIDTKRDRGTREAFAELDTKNTKFSTSESNKYADRTAENANWSDVTIALANDLTTPGERLTEAVAGPKYVNALISKNSDAEKIADALLRQIDRQNLPKENVKLNIAGNDITTLKKAGMSQQDINNFVQSVIMHLQNKGITISEIRSGGQTGVDEAGIITAQRLNIPNTVHTTKGYAFRNEDGKDIFDELAFKKRFATNAKATPKATKSGRMSQSFDGNKRLNVQSENTLDAVIKGEKTAETRYASDKHIDYWKDAKEGDIIEWKDRKGNKVWVRVTKPLTKLEEDTNAEEWSKKEGWSQDHYLNEVLPKIKAENDDAYQIEFEYVDHETVGLKSQGATYDRGSYFTDNDLEEFASQVDAAIQQAIDSGKTIVIPAAGIGTGKAQLKERAPKLYAFLQHRLEHLPKRSQADKLSNSKIFELEPVAVDDSSMDVREKAIALDMDVYTRRQRTRMIARNFSDLVDIMRDEHRNRLQDMIANESSEERKTALRQELEQSKDRRWIIQYYGPAVIFERVRREFVDWIEMGEEEQMQVTMDELNANSHYDNWTEARKIEFARKDAATRRDAITKMLKHWELLAEDASDILVYTEALKINFNSKAAEKAQQREDGNFMDDEQAGKEDGERTKDGWMTDFRLLSANESLTEKVRSVLNSLTRRERDGWHEACDDIGFPEYIDPSYAHVCLLQALEPMTTAADMLPLIEKMVERKPWLTQILEKIKEDPTIFSQFYQCYRKDVAHYWIQVINTDANGQEHTRTKSLYITESISYLLDEWKDNVYSGYQMSPLSVYDKQGNIQWWEYDYQNPNLTEEERTKLREDHKEGETTEEYEARHRTNIANVAITASALLKECKDFEGDKETVDKETRWKRYVEWVSKDDNIARIQPCLGAFGITVTDQQLKDALTNENKNIDWAEVERPIVTILGNVAGMASQLVNKRVVLEVNTRPDSTKVREDLFSKFRTRYRDIAVAINETAEDITETTCRENDKSYSTHVNPSYLGKLLKELKGSMQSRERLRDFMDRQYAQYPQFYDAKNNKWRLPILQRVADVAYNGASVDTLKDILNHKILLNRGKVEYQKWDDVTYLVTMIEEYNSVLGRRTGYFHIPTMSAIESAEFIELPVYDVLMDDNGEWLRNGVLPHLAEIVLQELERIDDVIRRDWLYHATDEEIAQNVRSRGFTGTEFDAEFERLIKAKEQLAPIGNYDIIRGEDGRIKSMGGAEFKFFPKLNEMTFIEDSNNPVEHGNLTFREKLLQKKQNSSGAEFREWLESIISDMVEESFQEDYQKWEEMGLFEKVDNGATKYGDYGIDFYRQYYWNSMLATATIIQLTTADLAYYKDLKEFQKRFLEIHGPTLKLNTEATDADGVKIGKSNYKCVYIKDVIIKSNWLSEIEEVLDEKVRKGDLTEVSKKAILKAFKKVNLADGQSYRSLASYRDIRRMAGDWSDQDEKAYWNFKSGNWTVEDFSVLWQPIKPFVYTQCSVLDPVSGQRIKVPVQHKNSEFPLLAEYLPSGSTLGASSKLRALSTFMNKHGIDVVHFESAVKVGKYGVVSLNDTDISAHFAVPEEYGVPEEMVLKYLEDATDIGNKNADTNMFIHTIDYNDYGIQQPTPEHGIDAIGLFGTQLRKLITAKMPDNAVITMTYIDNNGREKTESLTKREWLDRYNEILTENVIQSFAQINEEFQDPKKVERLLQDQIRGNARYDRELMKACTLDKTGRRFNIPLYDPVQSMRVQQLINSIIKNRVTRQKIKGGSLVQVSRWGISDDLEIAWETMPDGRKRIKYMECYMPAYSKEFYDICADKDKDGNIILNPDKLPENLRRLVGYRIPTEGNASLCPLRIKGFLPQQNGGCVMLPAEITAIAGSDFDIDKLYIMLPEFRVEKYDKQKARKAYTKEAQALGQLKALGQIGEEIGEELLDEKSLHKWALESIDNGDPYHLLYDTPKARKIEYDTTKPAKDQSLKARNNQLIDLITAMLTSPEGTEQMLTPAGTFDTLEQQARVIEILENSTEETLTKAITDAGYTIRKDIYTTLLDMPLDAVTNIAESIMPQLNPLSPLTTVYFQQQNMAGAGMIGIYANNNTSHAMAQHTSLAIRSNFAITINGRKLTSLHDSTVNFQEWLSSSVDNAKKPVLGSLNQNHTTVNASQLLARLGYTYQEVALFMNQPIIKEWTRAVAREPKLGRKPDKILEEIVEKYKKRAYLTPYVGFDSDKGFTSAELAENILIGKQVQDSWYNWLESGSEEREDPQEGYNIRKKDKAFQDFAFKQFMVGVMFQKVYTAGEDLSKYTRATKVDTQGGAAGPSIADTMDKIQAIESLEKSGMSKKFSLVGHLDLVRNLNADGTTDDLRRECMASPVPFMQAFYTCGIRGTEEIFKRWFPHYKPAFRRVIDYFNEISKRDKLSTKTVNKIYNDLFAYILSDTEFFGEEKNEEGIVTNTARDKRNAFINGFPGYLAKMKKEFPEITSLALIKRLTWQAANDKTPTATIVAKNVGSLNKQQRDSMAQDWNSLLTSTNPKLQQLGLNLMRYTYYRNGFAFGPNTYSHLASMLIRINLPEYIERLERIMEEAEHDTAYAQFIDQFIFNNLHNRELVGEYKGEGFLDEKGNPLKKVTKVLNPDNLKDQRIFQTVDVLGGKLFIFDKYIAINAGKDFVYYRLNAQESSQHTGLVTYERVQPLGYKNQFLEYEFGRDAEDMVSVIERNNPDYNPNKDDNTSEEGDSYTSRMTEELDTMTDEEFAAFMGTDGESNITSENSLPSEAAPDTGESIQTRSILSIQAEEFTDADDRGLCGNVIATF